MIKEHKELFQQLLEKFTENSSCRFFCNENEDFKKLWQTPSFQKNIREFAQEFVNEHYPEMKVDQENITEDWPLFRNRPFNKTLGEMRIEFLNWLIPQL